MTLRVLHFFKTYFPDTFGGIERSIHAIATGAAAHGIGTSVLSLSDDPVANEIEHDGISACKERTAFTLGKSPFSFSPNLFRRFGHLARQSDVVHYHYPWPLMDIVERLFLNPRPYIVTYHSDIIANWFVRLVAFGLERKLLRRASAIVATSPHYARTSSNLKNFRDKVRIVPLGLPDLAKVVDDDAHERWRARLGEPFFLTVGQLRHYKGMEILIEASKHCRLPVLVIGGGDRLGDLTALAEATPGANIRFLGPLPDEDKHAL